MEYRIGSAERRVENICLRYITAGFEDLYSRIPQSTGKITSRSSDKIIKNYNFGNVLLRELVDTVGADQAGPANHNNALTLDIHVNFPSEITPTWI